MNPIGEALGFAIGITTMLIKGIVKLAWIGGTSAGQHIADKKEKVSESELREQSATYSTSSQICLECSTANQPTDVLCYVCGAELQASAAETSSNSSGLGRAVESAFIQLLPMLGGVAAVLFTCVICNACGQYT